MSSVESSYEKRMAEVILSINSLPQKSSLKEIESTTKKINHFLQDFTAKIESLDKDDPFNHNLRMTSIDALKKCVSEAEQEILKGADEIDCLAVCFRIKSISLNLFEILSTTSIETPIYSSQVIEQLKSACMRNDIEQARKLILQHQIDVNICGYEDNGSLLQQACFAGCSHEMINFLIKAGGKLDVALFRNICEGNLSIKRKVELLKLLVPQGLTPLMKDEVGDVAIKSLFDLKNGLVPAAILRCLIELGLDVNAVADKEGNTLLDCAFLIPKDEQNILIRSDLARILIFAGAKTENTLEKLEKYPKSKNHRTEAIQDAIAIREKVMKTLDLPKGTEKEYSEKVFALLKKTPTLSSHRDDILNIVNEFGNWHEDIFKMCMETPENKKWMAEQVNFWQRHDPLYSF